VTDTEQAKRTRESRSPSVPLCLSECSLMSLIQRFSTLLPALLWPIPTQRPLTHSDSICLIERFDVFWHRLGYQSEHRSVHDHEYPNYRRISAVKWSGTGFKRGGNFQGQAQAYKRSGHFQGQAQACGRSGGHCQSGRKVSVRASKRWSSRFLQSTRSTAAPSEGGVRRDSRGRWKMVIVRPLRS
jgi:hypothetical protein